MLIIIKVEPLLSLFIEFLIIYKPGEKIKKANVLLYNFIKAYKVWNEYSVNLQTN